MPEKFRFMTRPLFLQVRDELATRVAGGIWKPGAMIPNEVDLAAELGVGQGTVRKALDLMEAEKILVRRQGRGTFVIDHDAEVMAIRFSSIQDLEGKKVDGEIACQRTEFFNADAEMQQRLDVVPSDVIVRTHRLHKYHGRVFMWENSNLALRHWTGLSEDNASYDRITSLGQRCGIILSHAVETVSPCVAEGEVCEKLNVAAGTPILLLERTVFSDRGTRVEWRQAWTALRDKRYVSVMS